VTRHTPAPLAFFSAPLFLTRFSGCLLFVLFPLIFVGHCATSLPRWPSITVFHFVVGQVIGCSQAWAPTRRGNQAVRIDFGKASPVRFSVRLKREGEDQALELRGWIVHHTYATRPSGRPRAVRTLPTRIEAGQCRPARHEWLASRAKWAGLADGPENPRIMTFRRFCSCRRRWAPERCLFSIVETARPRKNNRPTRRALSGLAGDNAGQTGKDRVRIDARKTGGIRPGTGPIIFS